MIKTKEVAKLLLDGAEIALDRSSKRWQVAGRDMPTQFLLKNWKELGYIKSDRTRLELYKEYYKLTPEGEEALTRLYFSAKGKGQLP